MSEAPVGGAVARLRRRERGLLLAAVGSLAALCWLAMGVEHTATRPHAIESGLRAVLVGWAMWLTMVAAMMLPIVTPWILLFAGLSHRGSPAARWRFSTLSFVGGYLAVWGAYSLIAAAMQLGLQRAAWLHGPEMRVGATVGGGLLIVAGIFQLTPLKSACLRHCRTPLGFLLTRWRSGPSGAFRLGLTHGAFCVACCWALMALAFVLGVMNLSWMAALTLVMCAEKLMPRGPTLARVFGVAFVAWGAWLIGGS